MGYSPWSCKQWDTTEQLSMAHRTMTITKWRQTHRCREQNNTSGKKEWGQGKRGPGVQRYKLLCMKEMSYKDILYNTGNIANLLE